jgi:hypothetical protein
MIQLHLCSLPHPPSQLLRSLSNIQCPTLCPMSTAPPSAPPSAQFSRRSSRRILCFVRPVVVPIPSSLVFAVRRRQRSSVMHPTIIGRSPVVHPHRPLPVTRCPTPINHLPPSFNSAHRRRPLSIAHRPSKTVHHGRPMLFALGTPSAWCNSMTQPNFLASGRTSRCQSPTH